MTTACMLCASGPRGDMGHPAMREEFRSGMEPNGEASYVLFSCVICGSRWGRGRGVGDFTWRAKASAGLTY